ncbi:MAG TPA: hypothetical protein VKB88_38940 [Bryobacteraceae bacterium]|nr:hypothetical protein [Bryobacteraceae bacterium]
MKVSRRQVTAAVLVGQAIRLSAAPEAPDAELQAARDRLKTNAQALSAVSVPRDTEPAFQFKA